MRQAGRWSRRDGAKCFLLRVECFETKRGGRGKQKKPGEEINGLAKEWGSYTGIRMDKCRTCGWGGEIRRSLQKRNDMILFFALIPSHI